MPISIGTRIPPCLGQQGLDKVAAFSHETGLTAIDVPRLTEEVAALCDRFQLRLGTVDLQDVGQLLSSDAQKRRSATQSVQNQIRDAAKLGANLFFMCLVPEDTAQSIQTSLAYFEETFPSIVETCESANARIALEGWPGPGPHYATLGYTPEVWRAMFAIIPSPALGLCFDPSHLVRLGIDYRRVFSEFRERVYHCHGKDTQLLSESQYLYGNLSARLDSVPGFSEGSWRYCIPGDGEVDWKRVAFDLTQAGYQGCVSIELEDARYWGSLEKEQQGIRKAFHHLSAHFA